MGSIVPFLALNALVWWVVLLVHELGHAAVGLARTEGLVVVRAGSRSPKWRRRFGRLQLELGPVPMFSPADALAEVHARLGWRAKVLFALAGPAAGSLAASSFILLGWHFQFLPLQVMGWLALALDLANLIPFRFRGTRSDGAYLLDAMRSRAPGVGEWDDEIEAIVSRWVVLATDFRGAFSARDRDLLGRLNNKMRDAKLDQDDEALAVHRMTFAGWCWRKAEQGDTTPIRDSVLDARHRATRERQGMNRANIIGAAAGELVRERVDLAAGSPTPDSLEQGYRRARANAQLRELSEPKARVAFCFGVAMHDVATMAG